MSEESEIATPLDYVEYDFDSFNSTNTPDHPSAQSNFTVPDLYKFFTNFLGRPLRKWTFK
jgi:hypothetical protein